MFLSLSLQAKICVLYHPTEITRLFRTSVHVGSIRQTAVIQAIHPGDRIRTNDAASVVFKFLRSPEYLKVGQRLLFRDGRTKGIGRVTQIFPFEKPEELNR